jgi:hypothetical protein
MFEMMALSNNQRYGLRIEKTQLADSTTYELLEACFSHDRSMHQLCRVDLPTALWSILYRFTVEGLLVCLAVVGC